MQNFLFIILVSCFAATAGADVGKLTARDAVTFGDFLTRQKVVDDMKYGAHPAQAVAFFKSAFDPKACAAPTSPFKSWDLEVKTGQVFCLESDRFNADIMCTLENYKKTHKTTITGAEAYEAVQFLRAAGVKPQKASPGVAYVAGVVDCIYSGVQTCLGNNEKGGACKLL